MNNAETLAPPLDPEAHEGHEELLSVAERYANLRKGLDNFTIPSVKGLLRTNEAFTDPDELGVNEDPATGNFVDAQGNEIDGDLVRGVREGYSIDSWMIPDEDMPNAQAATKVTELNQLSVEDEKTARIYATREESKAVTDDEILKDYQDFIKRFMHLSTTLKRIESMGASSAAAEPIVVAGTEPVVPLVEPAKGARPIPRQRNRPGTPGSVLTRSDWRQETLEFPSALEEPLGARGTDTSGDLPLEFPAKPPATPLEAPSKAPSEAPVVQAEAVAPLPEYGELSKQESKLLKMLARYDELASKSKIRGRHESEMARLFAHGDALRDKLGARGDLIAAHHPKFLESLQRFGMLRGADTEVLQQGLTLAEAQAAAAAAEESPMTQPEATTTPEAPKESRRRKLGRLVMRALHVAGQANPLYQFSAEHSVLDDEPEVVVPEVTTPPVVPAEAVAVEEAPTKETLRARARRRLGAIANRAVSSVNLAETARTARALEDLRAEQEQQAQRQANHSAAMKNLRTAARRARRSPRKR